MCGITGKCNTNPEQPVNLQLIHQMNQVLTHRGPDDSGQWSTGRVALGQRRLAIVDLSPAGHQPMSNEDGSVWITFNGEIYNHPLLQPELEKKGHHYQGHSDTQTILHLYEEHGRNCVQHLRGMFAFALWDTHQQTLLLARDRLGKKPLLYAHTPETIVFASELKAIVQDPAVPLDIDPVALHYYLTYGFIPAPYTIFKAIRKLPPATTLLWQNGRVSLETYWQLTYEPKLNLTEAEATEQLLAHLQEAVKIRLMSDVPLGAFLSGGVDSSAVVALMASATSTPVKTFAIGFDDDSFDETPYAREVAQLYGCDHHEFKVTPDVVHVLPELVWGYGEPFADSSALPTYYVSKMTRQHVTVALNGDGGDEAFAGYERYKAQQLAGRYQQLPHWLKKGILEPFAQQLPAPEGRKNPIRRLKNFILAQQETPERSYIRWLTLMSNSQKTQLYHPAWANQLGSTDAQQWLVDTLQQTPWASPLDKLLATDVHSYLPDDLLVKVDIAAMLNSLEARSPFLDHQLLEFAAALPADFKLRGGQSKYLLKKALAKHLPHHILHRDKRGFAVPIGNWFKQELRTLTADVLLSPTAIQRGIFQEQALRQMLDEHQTGRQNHRYTIWLLLMLELWFRTYIDRPRAELTSYASNLW